MHQKKNEPKYLSTKEKIITSKEGITKTINIDASEEKYETREKEWYIFVNSYLTLSEIGCEQLLQSGKLTIKKKYIIISTIYNLKHSLELMIKTFTRIINKNTNKNDRDHDIKELFTALKRTIQKKSRNKEKKIKKEDIKLFNNQMISLEKIIIKYQELNFLNKHLQGCFTMHDKQNTFLRYPENSMQIRINYEKLLNKITKDNIKDLKTDIEKLIKIVPSIKKVIGQFL